ncbi:MAG: cytochrome c maturation protein CcmE [Candidatus Dadabacteria bacterium]|nr:MAG: cytochrome c maturation protein CcmE [Candidatus Dadabacteria bacterium]
MKIFWSIVVAVVAFVVLFMFQATRGTATTVFLPSKLIEIESKSHLRRVRVAGRVAGDSIDYQVEPKLKLSFEIKDPQGNSETTLPVVYNGIKPDMFAPGRDVIIEGEYKNGTVYASSLLTQCPSKYEPPDSPGVKRQGDYHQKGLGQ